MSGDFRGGEAAVVRLAGGVPLRAALTVADPLAWLALDICVRTVDWYRPGSLPQWEHTAPLPAGAASFDEPRLALALCHRDGRIRERAVRQAAAYPGLLPLLVIRASDWAEPARERARALLRDLLDVESAVALTPLTLLVGRRDRGDAAVGLLGEILRRSPRERLCALFGHADRDVRRFAYRLAVEERLLTPAELARTASRDEDAVVQTLCGEAAVAAGDPSMGAPDDDVLTPLLAARSPRVRAIGVTALRRAGRPAQGEEFLADRGRTPRTARATAADPR
ncbi:hypothetical protein ACFYNZ_31875 [Streptomyces kebangsaanensis]|uniref:HEAT repeat domain-containing protein n=1 Tax=Streptomyces kebangsaanensis TaxID=864058 RepID=A0ABW6L481_9ACTN